MNRGGDGRLGPLLWRHTTVRLAGTRVLALFVFGAGARADEKLLAELPGQLDRIDGWIEAGVLNGEELNAADFMIAPSVALLRTAAIFERRSSSGRSSASWTGCYPSLTPS